MKALIGTWGRSAAVRLPKAYLEALGLKPGDEVELTLEAGKVTVAAGAKPAPAPLDRDALFALMKEQEPPEIVDWGPDVEALAVPRGPDLGR